MSYGVNDCRHHGKSIFNDINNEGRVFLKSDMVQETSECFMRVETCWNDQIHIDRTQTLQNGMWEHTAMKTHAWIWQVVLNNGQ